MRSFIGNFFIVGLFVVLFVGTLARAGAFRKLVANISLQWARDGKTGTAYSTIDAARMLGLISETAYKDLRIAVAQIIDLKELEP